MSKKRAKKRTTNKKSLLVMSVTLAFIVLVLRIQTRELEKEMKINAQENERLLGQLQSEEERELEIEELTKYMQTKQYMESVARDKLGLIYEGEKILKPSN
jgi:hypothetical protein